LEKKIDLPQMHFKDRGFPKKAKFLANIIFSGVSGGFYQESGACQNGSINRRGTGFARDMANQK